MIFVSWFVLSVMFQTLVFQHD